MKNQTEPQQENTALQEQLDAAYPKRETRSEAEFIPEQLSPEEALQAFSTNPVAFIRHVVDNAAKEHLSNMKEEAELRGALLAFRKTNPEARQFEPFVLQEVAELIKNDNDGDIESWEKLLEKGLEVFKEKFKEALKQNPGLREKQPTQAPEIQMESSANRQPAQAAPSFTRDQIARMSLSEFVAQEEAINEALKSKRIR